MSFPSWEHSARAHIGRLLAYALTDEQANTAQRVLISETLGERGIRADYRGAAPVLRGLQGRWAVPGKTYASKIAGIANSIAAVKLPKQTGQMP